MSEPQFLTEKVIPIEESKKHPVKGTNGALRPKDCDYCKLYGHTGTYCPQKYKDYPDMQPYVEKFPGEEAVYEAISKNLEIMDKWSTTIDNLSQQINKLVDIVTTQSARIERLERQINF